MPVSFVVYIDESGDTGLEQIKKPDDPKGATEWLVLSAFLVRIQNDSEMVTWTRDVQEQFISRRADLHFNKLLPFKKTHVCAALATKLARCFVAMSNKKNIEKYKNPRLDDDNKAWIYWFLTRLLLERVTAFCAQHVPEARKDQDKLRIIFSRRGDLTYKDFTDYLRRMYYERGAQVLGYKELDWSVIDFDEIYAHDHGDRAGLQLADVIASSFFQAVELNRGAQVECDPSYAKLLKPLMHHNGRRWYLGFGVKPMPLLGEMNLTDPQKELFTFYGANANSWRKK
ncbi:DUF3800 domain-containing protein [Nitrobacter sp.]|uniref:DUF3800 domain-containing protein n=1 Tax=Nitrobacter sp. TaxID=29420 RepID=UPI003F64FAE1